MKACPGVVPAMCRFMRGKRSVSRTWTQKWAHMLFYTINNLNVILLHTHFSKKTGSNKKDYFVPFSRFSLSSSSSW